MTAFVRTPDERFSDLPDFAWEPSYTEWEGLRLHYIDVGEGKPVVLFHGEPTWSFLYRHVIKALVEAGYRAVAPDLPGFGRSDKPTDPDFYTYEMHTSAATHILTALDLTDATAVVQDWGGPIGLRCAVEMPERFSRLSILNTGLFTGGRVSKGFLAWRAFVERSADLPIERVMRGAAIRDWPESVAAGYEAPFPDASHKVGAHRFPLIVPLEETDPGAAEMLRVRSELGGWDRPTQVLFGTSDPIFPVRVGENWVERVPGADRLETVDAGHFLQEDAGAEVGAALVAFLDRTSSALE